MHNNDNTQMHLKIHNSNQSIVTTRAHVPSTLAFIPLSQFVMTTPTTTSSYDSIVTANYIKFIGSASIVETQLPLPQVMASFNEALNDALMPSRPETQHEQSLVPAEMRRLGQLDVMNDWDEILDLRNETSPSFTKAVISATFDDFYDEETAVPEASDEPSAGSSIHHHHDRCKRSDSEDTWFWPNTKG